MSSEYFEQKKHAGLIFTNNNLFEDGDYTSMYKTCESSPSATPVGPPERGISWWDIKKHRYRTAKEQAAIEADTVSKNEEYYEIQRHSMAAQFMRQASLNKISGRK